MDLPIDLLEDIEWRKDRINISMAKDDALKASSLYVQSRHPEAICALMTGSYANGQPIGSSDVDLYVLNDEASSPLREAILVSGYPLQVSIMCSIDLYDWIEQSNIYGLMGALHALKYSDYVYGSLDTFKKIKNMSSTYINNLTHPRIDHIRYFRFSLMCNYIKLIKPLDLLDRTDNLIRLVRSAADFVQARAGVKRTGRASCEPSLRSEPIYAAIVEALPDALLGNLENITALTWKLLNVDGPPLWETYPDGPMPLFL